MLGLSAWPPGTAFSLFSSMLAGLVMERLSLEILRSAQNDMLPIVTLSEAKGLALLEILRFAQNDWRRAQNDVAKGSERHSALSLPSCCHPKRSGALPYCHPEHR